MQFRKSFLLALLIMTFIACSPKQMIVKQTVEMVDTGVAAFEQDDDLDFLEKALPANIKLLETLLVSDPDNIQLRTLLARLYGSYAFGFAETRLEQVLVSDGSTGIDKSQATHLKNQVNRYYEKGGNYALSAMEISIPGAKVALAKVGTVDLYLNQLGRNQVAALYWYGFNLGAWINHNLDSVRAVSRAHVARKAMERVIQIDPAFNHGGAHLFLMAYFGSRPAMMGGSQAKAADHYHQLKHLAGDDYMLPDLFYGRFCLLPQQDRERFVDLMRRIVDHATVTQELALYNAIAGRRAAIYLSAVDRLFE